MSKGGLALTLEEKHLQVVHEAFSKSPFWSFMGCTLISLRVGEVEIKLDVRHELLNVVGTTHGGVYASLIDTTMGMTASSVEDGLFVTVNLNIHYIKAITKGSVWSKGKVINKGRSLYTISTEIFDDEGNLCAYGTGTFKLVKQR